MPKNPTWKVICLSLYERDLELVDAQIAELKRRGVSTANRSMIVRLALAQLDLDQVMREGAPRHPGRSVEQLALISRAKDPA